MLANVEEEDAIEYTDDELEMSDEDMKRVFFKIRLDNKGLVLNKAFFMKKTARATCMIMNEYVNLKPQQEQIAMLMPMFIINQYKKKKKYLQNDSDSEGETNYDKFEDLHEFHL